MADTAAMELHRALNGNTEFLDQLCGVLFNAARDIEANAQESEERKAWAAKVKTNRKAMAREMLADILENATIASNVTAATDAGLNWWQFARPYGLNWTTKTRMRIDRRMAGGDDRVNPSYDNDRTANAARW